MLPITKQQLEPLVKKFEQINPDLAARITSVMKATSGPIVNLPKDLVNDLYMYIHKRTDERKIEQIEQSTIECYDKMMINMINYHSPVVKEWRMYHK